MLLKLLNDPRMAAGQVLAELRAKNLGPPTGEQIRAAMAALDVMRAELAAAAHRADEREERKKTLDCLQALIFDKADQGAAGGEP